MDINKHASWLLGHIFEVLDKMDFESQKRLMRWGDVLMLRAQVLLHFGISLAEKEYKKFKVR
jgi:hypothetical protein